MGRRERKKMRTREALIDAAFELFSAKGFDATTVEEIADAVDVSSRTFFRYFASKEDVALTFQEDLMHGVLDAFAARPADEPVMTALRRAVVAVCRTCEAGGLGFDPGRFTCLLQLTSESGTLMAGSLEHTQKKMELITRAVARRMDVDPASDLRPHVVASTIGCGFQAAVEAMHSADLGYTSLADAADDAFAILENGVNFASAPADGTAETDDADGTSGGNGADGGAASGGTDGVKAHGEAGAKATAAGKG